MPKSPPTQIRETFEASYKTVSGMGAAASVIQQFVSMIRAERCANPVLSCVCGALLGKQGHARQFGLPPSRDAASGLDHG